MKNGKPAMLDKVRGAITRLTDPFDIRGVCQILGVDLGGAERAQVGIALRYLLEADELEIELITRQGVGGKLVRYRRTRCFREEEFNPGAQRFGGLFLQHLALDWGASRARAPFARLLAALPLAALPSGLHGGAGHMSATLGGLIAPSGIRAHDGPAH